MNQTKVPVDQCPCISVVVYADRAEVTRLVEVDLTDGQNQIVVQKLSQFIEKDSVRVEGTGDATITEVMFEEKQAKQPDPETTAEKDMREKLKQLKHREKVIENSKSRSDKRKEVMIGIADQVSKKSCGEKENLLAKDSISGIAKFLSFYENNMDELDSEALKIEDELQNTKDEIRLIQQELNKFRNQFQGLISENNVFIYLECTKEGIAKLFISYIVFNARWQPSYDVRVFTADNVLKVFYYGMIQQSTGEDWNDTTLSLSTAQPSVGGACPKLGNQRVSFYEPPRMAMLSMNRRKSKREGMFKTRMGRQTDSIPVSNSNSYGYEEYDPTIEDEMVQQTTEVVESVISTSFEIPVTSSVPSDPNEHKVSVGIVDLVPEFSYETVPVKSSLAYLKSKAVNTSKYAFLPGKISVFVDNNFVAKSEMTSVSPNEEFWCSLGVDPSVRISYKPVMKFHSEYGMLSKSHVVTYEQPIEVKNTKSKSVNIKVVDYLPQSTDEKIKVNLMEPMVSEKGTDIVINKQNNVEWNIKVAGQGTKELKVKYQIEYPKSKTIELNVLDE